MEKRVLCFDFGASSGRAVLAWYDNGTIAAEEVHRFKNRSVSVNGTLYWDILALYSEIKTGLVKAHRKGGFSSVGIDTWGVDYGIIDKNGFLIGNPVQYRDKRTKGMLEAADRLIGLGKLYSLTGSQIMPINTAFQLLSEKNNRLYILENGAFMLPVPDLLCYMLTGNISAELSIASTTQLFNPEKRCWSDDAIEALGLPRKIFPDIIMPGDSKGMLSRELCDELNIPSAEVIAVCGHDTQCAYFAAPVKTKNSVIISCGTWSLTGIITDKPVLNEKARLLGITNEVGYDGSINLLKNITGLWLIQETKAFLEAQGQEYSYAELEALARECDSFTAFIDTDAEEFSVSGDIPQRIKDYCIRTGQKPPQTLGEVMKTIYLSLAMKYRLAIEQLFELTEISYDKIDTIHIVGGGCKDSFLCQLTADICGVNVEAGPSEATVYGNAAIQLIKNDVFSVIEKQHIIARTAENQSINSNGCCLQRIYEPKTSFEAEYTGFKKIINER